MAQHSGDYQSAGLPDNEEARLTELQSLGLMNTASEQRFDRYTRLIADIFQFPVVLISLLDRDRQWFKSAYGWTLTETSRDVSFCAHTIRQHRDVFVVPDTTGDPRFAGNPLVTGEPYIRFYAGAAVHGPGGLPVGTLCVIDHVPREMNQRERRQLRQFADLVESELHHVHDLNSLRASMQYSAYYDPLTQLPNRRLLMDRLQNLIELCREDRRRILVLLFNIKGLRLINQTYGTATGDEILNQLADRLRKHAPPGGTAARLQADECVLVLPGQNGDAPDIDARAERVRLDVNRPYAIDHHEHYLEIQVGGSVFPDHGVTALRLIERAAAAIRMPGSGQGIRYLNKAQSLDISRRLEIESRLRRATEIRAFELWYQPISSISTGRPVSVEALLRWHDEDLGEVSPAQFIPIAEQSGLIIAIGRWVILQAFDQMSRWHRPGGCGLPVGVNVAAEQLQDPHFATQVVDQLKALGLDPRSLHIEFTEFSLVSNSRYVIENMHILNEAGVRIFIDDFGTGYSSLEYLGRMPITGIKIDHSFVAGLPHDGHNVTMARTILSMAHSLNLQAVAEGVESQAQLDFLRHNGCDLVQGFLLARPMTAAGVASLPPNLFAQT